MWEDQLTALQKKRPYYFANCGLNRCSVFDTDNPFCVGNVYLPMSEQERPCSFLTSVQSWAQSSGLKLSSVNFKVLIPGPQYISLLYVFHF